MAAVERKGLRRVPVGAETSAPAWLLLALLAGVCVASLVVIVVLGTHLAFFNDDWYFLLQRPGLESHGGADVLFAPHNSNLVFFPALAYKALVLLFGLGSQVPFRLLLGLLVVAVGMLVYVLVSARVGRLGGLFAAVVVLFLGAAWEDLLFFASIDLVGSLATGLGALWALERAGQKRDAAACVLLVCSVGFSNVGIPFAGAAAVALALRGRWRQLWIAVVPLVLFGAWWAIDGSNQPSHLSWHNVAHLPRYLIDSASMGLASVFGLDRGSVSASYTRGHILLALATVALIFALVRGWRPPNTVLVPAAGLLIFWILTGASYIPGRAPDSSRYLLIDAALLILIAAELLRDVRLGPVLGAGLALITVAAVFSNIDGRLSYGYHFLQNQAGYAKAELGALEIGRALAPRALWLTATVARNPYLSGITAGRLFAETNAHGQLPTYSAKQIATATPPQRQGADAVLISAEQLSPTPTTARPLASAICQRVDTTRSPGATLTAGKWLLRDVGATGLAIGFRRFAPAQLPVYAALIAPGTTEQLAIPSDTLPLPWHLFIKAPSQTPTGALEVCTA